ncbi:sulfotransferase domain-containing protein [Catenuloplanes atrovinosus]|uniref:Sulfotransferase domain-containing protein n=1 Tax=Catenuloplanes atrovinosus TaxID=137266 RepID=A0AAE3YPQ3_9ACTN|nr:sulfotransferase domain-containing protein [Catenuloplanes atrovinosus]MDR7276967.1 hypothetical protein [Catenuloplanes atrovinosus]
MTRISWIASYPKSGNTWLRSMLTAYIGGAPAESLRGLQQLIPDIHPMIAEGGVPPWDDDGSYLVKTHFLPDVPLLRLYRDLSRKAVYIVRNPRDVLLSSLRMMHISRDDTAACRRIAEGFIAHESFFADRGRIGIGSWTENLKAWSSPDIVRRSFPDIEILTVRYEDMRGDPVGEFTEIVKFLELGRPVRDRDIQLAVDGSTIDRMREMEKKDKAGRKPPPVTRWAGKEPGNAFSFIGEGKQGQSLAFMGQDIEDAYRERLRDGSEFAALAARFGYDH